MEKFILIFSNILFIQVMDKNTSEFLFSSAIYVFTLICLISAVIVMMLIPIMLCYSIIIHYFNLKEINAKLKTFDSEDSIDKKSKFHQEVCDNYVKEFTNFMKSSLGLVAWNIFSIIYIISGFEDLKTGLIEYFYFPFKIIKTFDENEIFNSYLDFSSNWSYMLSIIALTFVFFFIGKFVGIYLGRTQIKKIGFSIYEF